MTMKSKCSISVGLVLVFAAAAKSLAVVPPSTSVEEGIQAPSDAAEREKAAFRQSHAVIERLEDDKRRLEEVLDDLKEDSQELKRSFGEPKPVNNTPGSVK